LSGQELERVENAAEGWMDGWMDAEESEEVCGRCEIGRKGGRERWEDGEDVIVEAMG
jgi:hypothetical protein